MTRIERHGGDIYRHPVALDYSICINPLGMPELAKEAAIYGLDRAGSYPDTEVRALKEQIAGYLERFMKDSLETDMILPGNGAAELIYALCATMKPREALVLKPGFTEYARAVQVNGGHVRTIDLKAENGFALPENLADLIGSATDVIFICNPNNPTGNAFERAKLIELAKIALRKGVRVVVDECFLPFCDDEAERTMIEEIYSFPNLVVLRAFTKIYAMAGLRLGYLVTDDIEFLEAMRDHLQPWNVSIPAQMAGTAALSNVQRNEQYLAETRKLIREERAYLTEELKKGLAEQVFEGSANFILFKSIPDLKERLMEEGILIRSFTAAEGPGRGYFRIGVRKHIDNQRLIDIMTDVVRHS